MDAWADRNQIEGLAFQYYGAEGKKCEPNNLILKMSPNSNQSLFVLWVSVAWLSGVTFRDFIYGQTDIYSFCGLLPMVFGYRAGAKYTNIPVFSKESTTGVLVAKILCFGLLLNFLLWTIIGENPKGLQLFKVFALVISYVILTVIGSCKIFSIVNWVTEVDNTAAPTENINERISPRLLITLGLLFIVPIIFLMIFAQHVNGRYYQFVVNTGFSMISVLSLLMLMAANRILFAEIR